MDSDNTPVLDPETFYNTTRDEDTEQIIRDLVNRRKLEFFHWELVFPDVFSGDGRGFNAVVGNPPWDKEKPNSLEFFTRYNYFIVRGGDQTLWPTRLDVSAGRNHRGR